MDFKKATLIAFIGSLLMLLTATLWTINSAEGWDYLILGIIPTPILSIVNTVGSLLVTIFFYSLYKKQN